MSLNNTNPVETDVIFGLINDIEKYIGQNLTTTVTDKLAKAFNKIYATQGKEVPREVIEFSIRKRPGEKWSLVIAKNDVGEVVCDIYETDKDGGKKTHQERAAVLKPVVNPINVESLPLLTLQEISHKIANRHLELWLTNAAAPDEMLDIVIKNGVAGSGTSPHSPLYTYDLSTGIITVSYEHIQSVTGKSNDYYRLNTKLPTKPTLVDYVKADIEVSAERRAEITSGKNYADTITELFRVISMYFPVTIDVSLKSLKELVDKTESSDGKFKLMGYSIPVVSCEVEGYWSPNNTMVVLSKELVEEIILFNTDMPLSTKGEIIEEIVGFPPEPTFLTEITNAVNQVFHSTRAEVGGITMRYSKTTGNVIIKERKVNEHKTWLFRVSEKSIEIDTDPTLRDFLTVPDIDIATWTERNEPGTFSVLGNMENLLNECIGHGVSSTQPFVDLMSSNTVTMGDSIFKVLSSYHPTVKVYSPKGTSLYLLTKDLIEKLYDIKRNPPMTTALEDQKFVMDVSSTIPEDDFNRILQDINNATRLALSAAGVSQVYIAFTKLYKHRDNPEYNSGIDLPLYRRANGDQLGLSILYNDQTKSEIVCSIIDITGGCRTVIHPAVTILALPQSQEPKNSPLSSEGFIKEAFKARRIHNLVKKLETTGNPEEAYDLIVEFLGDDYEQEGSVKYKDVKIKYLIDYSKHNGQVKLDVSVIDIQDQRNDEPVFALLVRFKRESVHRVYESIKRLVEMCQ